MTAEAASLVQFTARPALAGMQGRATQFLRLHQRKCEGSLDRLADIDAVAVQVLEHKRSQSIVFVLN